MTHTLKAAEIMARWKAGMRFYEPGWPPMYQPQPYTPRSDLTQAQRDNMQRGREVQNARVKAHELMRTGGLAHATGTNFNPQDDLYPRRR